MIGDDKERERALRRLGKALDKLLALEGPLPDILLKLALSQPLKNQEYAAFRKQVMDVELAFHSAKPYLP